MVAHITVNSLDTLPNELALYVLHIQDRVLAKKDRFDVAISGGSLAKTMAEGLVGNPHARLSKWNIWLADERIVKNDHADSNFGVFEKEFLSKLPENERPVCFSLNDTDFDVASTPSAEFAKDYQARLIKELGPDPVIDLVYLGMGPDGHNCSLFPGHKLLEERELFVSSLDDSPKPPPRRITLTKRALANADHLVFVTIGSSKNEAIKGVFVKRDPALPSFQVNQLAKNEVVWFCDHDAVAGVNVPDINAKV
ncbi:6-phosphogluconolactonase 3 [Wickerhamiella sorbophila]|uniref:6-phosphogluconolactonase-like protein n=1 Tax=Wickerhamiella sorbophila TaxID=45607 RepID=A0A2T0FJE1_9ASCO|nr:6-phosphogluconolactonase 3 [Wickerhamiella sorbophila]PRT55096.1 6-phosphogluconolactonase 3 [Wickerhamiella sorbophila]